MGYYPYLSRPVTELARVHDSIKTDHLPYHHHYRRLVHGFQFGLYVLFTVRTPEPSDIHLDFIMAGHGHHSFNGPPKPPVAHVPRVYRFTATALGAGMWFFLMYRAKKDGAVLLGLKHPWDH
ncbi:hypothetical protein KAF25_008903 [Fusarium avenaceum]|uniref:NADH dehydrogenase [ubiquinone] 1 beta subcomplex subunit 2 n=3 Tax=Fusarium tricinctum species complex TaxID=679429 RepID=A0A9P7KN33_9HYPO|nr:hypothetical protein KAF25_008903 [Fusarium avenaceum]